ncbi:hypothetical protein [Arachidicoccus ginsenosidimutans]|uniref:hypothetical protein n=1 Tax=Arachidicoccus sp. BS20 TaxID=1850526 RepID=UPI0012E8F3C2|nr:hypothetical protein [Arachidicoccus sp. BS20]
MKNDCLRYPPKVIWDFLACRRIIFLWRHTLTSIRCHAAGLPAHGLVQKAYVLYIANTTSKVLDEPLVSEQTQQATTPQQKGVRLNLLT